MKTITIDESTHRRLEVLARGLPVGDVMDPIASHQQQLATIERTVARTGRRGHIYLPATGPMVVTTAAGGHRTSEIVGPEPIRDAMGRAIGGELDIARWAETLKAATTKPGLVPPVIWNTVHLVVTGVTTAHALIIALHDTAGYSASDLSRLRDAAKLGGVELERAFSEATGTPLPAGARQWLPARRAGRTPGGETRGTEPEDGDETILTRLARRTRANPNEGETLKITMRGIARTWRNLSDQERRRTLAVPPCLSGTKWDALLAAVTEHLAWLTGYPRPGWVDEPNRFNNPPVSYCLLHKSNGLCWCPGAFLRHGALADPRDMDSRGGERHEWVPEERRGSTRRSDANR